VLPCGYLDDVANDGGRVALIRRKLSPREVRLLSITALLLAVGIATRLRSTSTSPTASSNHSRGAPLDELPRIDLKRLDAAPKESKAGERDIFEFGRPPVSEAPEATATPEPTTAPMANLAPTPPPVPTLPPLNLKFIGSLDNSRGIKVAVLMTEKNEILTGKVGEVVANRYKIDKIGFESVDLQDVTSGQTRRIPLRSK
jgi:hypothetical protein